MIDNWNILWFGRKLECVADKFLTYSVEYQAFSTLVKYNHLVWFEYTNFHTLINAFTANSCIVHFGLRRHVGRLRLGDNGPGVEVTKPNSPVPLFSEIFSTIKTRVRYWISPLYLAGVAAAHLRWHLSNMNVIRRVQHVLLPYGKFCLRTN